MSKKTIHICLSSCLFLASFSIAYGQGCSDAGFCTLDALKPNGSQVEQNQIKAGISYGMADHSITAIGNYIEYNRQLSESFGVDVKLTALGQNGNDLSVYGLSDIFLTGNYKMNEKATLTVGTKIPLTDGNRKEDGVPLPMDYQSSLGTLDLILGVGYQLGDLQIVGAYQQPLTQNGNEFFAGDFPADSDISDIQSTNQFKRKGDVLLRISYPVEVGEKFKITPSLLPIYHLGEDTFVDAFGNEVSISGSEGLTLNANLYFDYSFGANSAIQLNFGTPFVVRESRPDGLTRSFIASLEYRVRF